MDILASGNQYVLIKIFFVKISNEFKVGLIAIVSLVLLILGFNFLKGKELFSKSFTLYGSYHDVNGLQNSNPVTINGLQVGSVYKITPAKDMRRILVELNITKDVNIPANSIATIKSNPLGTTSIDIALGDATTFLKRKDSIITETSGSIFDNVLKKVDPVLYQVTKAVASIDTLLGSFNSILDPNAKGNIASSIENLTRITTSMSYSAASLQQLLNERTGALAQTLNNVSAITGNLASNNSKINSVVTNLDKTTTKLSELELQKTINTLDKAANELNTAMRTLNDKNGTAGKLLNDPALYQNFASSANKLNLLLDDIRLHPKRYINISVFGKKSKSEPLLVPLPDTLNSPYYIETTNELIYKN